MATESTAPPPDEQPVSFDESDSYAPRTTQLPQTGGKLRMEEKKRNVGHKLAFVLTVGLVGVILLATIAKICNPHLDMKDFSIVISGLTALVGSVIGFYFADDD